MKKGKITFLKEFSNLFFFWFVAVIFFFLFRITFILLYQEDINATLSFVDYANTFFMGFRFDITVISYFLILPFLSLYILIPLKKGKIAVIIRKVFQSVFILTSAIITVVDINYYKEYQDQFNHFMFMGLYDDQKAVLQTIISDYHPIRNGFFVLLLVFVLFKIFKHYENKTKIYTFLNSFQFKFRNLAFKILALLLFIGSIRGSYTEYPVRRFYAAVSPDNFVNKTIINPFRALNYAISDYNEINKNYDKNPFGEVPTSVKNNFETINQLLQKETNGLIKLEETPEQIFLVVMESYDSWPLMEKYKDLNISNNLREIRDKGINFSNFLPAANSTMNSLAAIISGIPYCGINMSKIGALNSYPSSIFEQFKKLGYETNIFFTVYSSWQNLGNFATKQGVDNVYDGTSSGAKKGIWGINDEALFENVLNRIDTTKKSLNIILTMSYHTPYEEDVFAQGFMYKTKKDLPKKYQNNYDEDKMPFNVLGHLWYADKALGNFVKKAEKKYSNSVFAFTGDHFGRRFINGKPTLYENSSVPFIIYGKKLQHLSEKKATPGSHIDITPTLLELVAPKKTSFASFGNSLLNKNTVGIGYNKTISKNLLLEYSKSYGTKKQVLDVEKSTLNEKILKQKHDSLMALAWHYTIKGDSIK